MIDPKKLLWTFGILIFSLSETIGSEVPKETPAEKTKEKTAEKAVGKEKEEKPAPENKKQESSKETKTHKVAAGPFKVEVELSGIVEAVEETAVSIDPEAWSDWTVVKAVPHGTEVKEGDVLVEIDREKLEKSIEEKREGLPIQEIDMEAARRDLDTLEKTTPIQLEKGRRSKMHAEEDLAYFEDVSKPMRVRDAQENVEAAANYLSYAQEELNQLKRMYENDDLTEETEEIILKRAENSVKQYQWSLQQTEERSKRSVNTLIPREHDNLKINLAEKQISWRSGEKSIREKLDKKRLEVAKQERDLNKARESLEEHEHDLANMTVKAPHDGIVYYGMSQRGKWTTAGIVEKKLLPGGKLTPSEVIMTVVKPKSLQVRVAVPEDKVTDLAEGQAGKTKLKWSPETEFASTVKSISYVPYADKTFDAVLSLAEAEEKMPVYPGMTATTKVVVYEKESALAIPKEAIKKEKEEEFVTLKGGKKQKVETGKTDGKKVEILKGLSAGNEIELPGESDNKASDKSTPAKK